MAGIEVARGEYMDNPAAEEKIHVEPIVVSFWRKFPDIKPPANQVCLVAAGPGRVVQHIALRWDEYKQEFMWVDSAEDSFGPFPTEEATHWMPFPNDPEV